MNQVNFLPPSFLEHQRKLRRVYRQALLIVFTLLAMVGWYTFSRGSLADMSRYAAALEAQTVAAREQNTEIARLQVQHEALNHVVKIQKDLEQPVGPGEILATVAQLLDAPMSVRELTLTTLRPPPPQPVDKNSTAPKPRASKAGMEPPDLVRVELTGLSPSDGQIANFVGRLSSHPMFTNVKMLFSRSISVGNVLAREFKIEMEVPLDCRYVFEDAPREATHAD